MVTPSPFLLIIIHCIFILITNTIIVTSFILSINSSLNIIIYCYFNPGETKPLPPNQIKIQFNSIQFNSIQFNSIRFNSIQFNSIVCPRKKNCGLLLAHQEEDLYLLSTTQISGS